MSYKKVIKEYGHDVIVYKDVDTTSGFIVGKYKDNMAFIIINNDWYLIDKKRILRNSLRHNALNYIFNSVQEYYSKDVRQYDNFYEASEYINSIIYDTEVK